MKPSRAVSSADATSRARRRRLGDPVLIGGVGQLHLRGRVIGPWSPTPGSDGEEANSLLPGASFKPAEPQSWASCLSGRARLHGRRPLRGHGAEGVTPSRAGRGEARGACGSQVGSCGSFLSVERLVWRPLDLVSWDCVERGQD